MLEIMIVTHGKLSEGLKDAAEVIVGTSSHIETMCLESGEDIQTFGEKVKEKLTMINTAEPMLVFVDLISASPYNQALLAVNELTEEKKAATYVIGRESANVVRSNQSSDASHTDRRSGGTNCQTRKR